MNLPLDLPATELTPLVRYDSSSGVLLLEGESYPENVATFYGPIMQWVRQAISENAPLKVVFSLDYLNTSSTKALLDLFYELDAYFQKGGATEITWRYRQGVEVMKEAGAELGEDLHLPFRLEEIV